MIPEPATPAANAEKVVAGLARRVCERMQKLEVLRVQRTQATAGRALASLSGTGLLGSGGRARPW